MLPQVLAYSIQTKIPSLIVGSPGIGKTKTIEQIADILELHLETVIGSITDPTEFLGLPEIVRDEDGEASVKALPPSWAKRLKNTGKGVLFLDELTDASPAVQAAMLRVILEGVVGELKLPAGVVRIAACNKPEEAANGHEISMPLRNRFMIINHEHDPEAWRKGMLEGWPAPQLDRLPSNWEENLPQSRALVTSYIKFAENDLQDMPQDGDNLSPYATPRSWDKVSIMLAALISTGRHSRMLAGDPESIGIYQKLIGGLIGRTSGKFCTWLKDMNLPTPEELLADYSKLPKDRDDKRWACLSSVATYVIRHKNDKEFTPKYWTPALLLLITVAKTYIDVAAATVHTLMSLPNNQIDPAIYPLPEGFEVFQALFEGM